MRKAKAKEIQNKEKNKKTYNKTIETAIIATQSQIRNRSQNRNVVSRARHIK